MHALMKALALRLFSLAVVCAAVSLPVAHAGLADANVTERDSDGQTALHKAAVYDWGSLADMQALVARGADLHAVDKDGFTPLHLAAMSGFTDKVRFLLEKGARFNTATKQGTLPLHLAAERRRTDTALLELLMGPPTNRVINAQDKESRTPLFRAVDADNVETVVWLLAHGADANLGKELPLSRAFVLNYMKVAEALCAGGANVNALDEDGLTLLTKAISRDKKDVIAFLLQHKADPNAKDKHLRTALHMAASKGNQSVMESLLALRGDINAADDEGRTPLDYAGESNPQWIAWLQAKGAKAGQPKPKPVETASNEEDEGNTPLHLAVEKADLAAVKAALSATPKLINLGNREGVTPLMLAVGNGWLEGAQALAAAGADLTLKNREGRNLAILAAGAGKLPLLKWVASKGVNPKEADNYGVTALYRAASRSLPCVQWLVEQGADINAKNKGGNTAMQQAISSDQLEIMRHLIDKGADLRVTDSSGATLLHFAARKKNPELARLLLAKGAVINARTNTGVTPLHRAADTKIAIETFKLLLAQGADRTAKDKDGKTPLDYATKYKNEAAIQLLK